MRRAFSCALLLTIIAFPLASQDSDLDDLFSDPVEDIAEEPSQTAQAPVDHRAAFQSQTSVSGEISATAGLILGWTEYPTLQAPTENWDMAGGAKSTVTAILVARPDPDVRLYGSVDVALNPASGSYTWSGVNVGQIYCDYTYRDFAFVRFGEHTISWGQGRLFTPGNLMSDSDAGSALRVSFPTFLSGLSFVALAQSGFFLEPSDPKPSEFAYGALADVVLGRLKLSFGARYRHAGAVLPAEGLRTLGSFKTTVLGTDLLWDAVFHYQDDAYDFKHLFGLYREWEHLKLYGECEYDGTVLDDRGWSYGGVVAWNNLGDRDIDLALKWIHKRSIDSGAVVLGVSGSPAKFIKASAAIPVVYGETGYFGILDSATDTDPLPITLTQRFSLVLLLKFTANF
jgi:hypothetical protein